MRINVDPNTDAGGFGYANPGEVELRIVDVELKDGQKAPYLAWKIEFVDPNIPTAELNSDGTSKKMGNIFENTTLKSGDNAQFRLRQLCDAVGIAWSAEVETDDFRGLTFFAMIDLDEYNGSIKNVIKKYIPKG